MSKYNYNYDNNYKYYFYHPPLYPLGMIMNLLSLFSSTFFTLNNRKRSQKCLRGSTKLDHHHIVICPTDGKGIGWEKGGSEGGWPDTNLNSSPPPFRAAHPLLREPDTQIMVSYFTLPQPGGPHRIIDGTSFASRRERRRLFFPTTLDCPT